MTDSKKLDMILSRLDKLDTLESEMQAMKCEMQVMKKDIGALKSQTMNSIADLKAMDKLILDEVERVHSILDKHKADKKMHLA